MPETRNGALSWLAGALMLATVPLSVVAVMLVAGGSGGDDYGPGPFEAFVEAGSFSYALIGISLLASATAMVFIALSGTRPTLQPLALASFVPTSVIALLGLKLNHAAVVEAVAHASGADQATIIAGSLGENLNLSLIAALVCVVGFGLLSFASLLTLGKEPRAPRFFTALTAGALSLASFALAFHTSAIIGTFRAVAHAAPGDRGTILGMSFMEVEPRRFAALGLLGLAVVLGVVGGAVVSRSLRPAGIALIGASLLAAGALFSADHAGRAVLSSAEEMEPWLADDLELVGAPGDAWNAVSLEASSKPEELDELIDENSRASRTTEQHRLSVYAAKDLSAPLLRHAMVRALANGAHLELVGRAKPEPVVSPEWSRVFVERLSARSAAARVELRGEDACEVCSGTAKLTGSSLEVTLKDAPATKWDPGQDPHFNMADADEWKPTQLDFTWSGSLQELLTASSIAFTHGAVLNVVAR